MAIKYFMYSSEQLKLRREIEKSMGKTFRVGQVIVNGARKQFTELSSSSKSRYADAKIVASGDPKTMKYTLPSSR